MASYEGIDGVRPRPTTNKLPVRVASTANIADFNNVATAIDGITLVVGDRVLVKDQSTTGQNGLYFCQSLGPVVLTRTRDWIDGEKDYALAGANVYVQQGATHAEKTFTMTTAGGVGFPTIGSTGLLWFALAGTTATTQTNAVFVSKAGSDSNTGITKDAPKLTIGSAITAANTLTPSTSNRVTIVIQDAGEYDEQVLLPGYVSLLGPNATVTGTQVSVVEPGTQSRIVLHRIVATGTSAVGFNAGAADGPCWVDVDEVTCASTGNPAVSSTAVNTCYLKIRRIIHTGGGAGLSASSTSDTVLEVGEIEVATGTGFLVGGTSVTASGSIGKITDTGAGTGLDINSSTGKVELVIGLIDCTTTYAVDTNNTLNLIVGDLIGSVGTINGTANITEAGVFPAAGDVSGPGVSLDNALPRFDLTTGKILQAGAASNNVILSDTGDLHPEVGNGGSLGLSSLRWSDLFLDTGAVINMNGTSIIGTSSSIMDFTGASTGYRFAGPVTPQVNDGSALGTTLRQWSNLFLASGSVLNWDNGNVTLTHAANALAFAGATSGYTFDAVVGGVTPTTSAHLTTKSYVDALVSGLTWQAPAAVRGYVGTRTVTEINALTPASGDSVVAGAAGTPTAGTSDLLAIGDIAEYDGTQWKIIVTNSGGFPPDGTRVLVHTDAVTLYSPLTEGVDESKYADWDGASLTPTLTTPADGDAILVNGDTSVNENKQFVYDGTVPSGLWVQFGGAGTSHADLSNLPWGSSGHTGTASRVAYFDGSGLPGYLQVGVDLQAYDATILVDADIGVNVQAYDAALVTGPGSAIDNAIPRFDLTTGKILQGGAASNNVLLSDTGDLTPEVSNGGALGTSSFQWSDLFLASGSVVNWAGSDVTLTHAANTLTFAGAATGYLFSGGPVRPTSNDGSALGTSTLAWSDLFLASGGVVGFNSGDVTITHAADALTFAGATNGYTFDNGPLLIDIVATPTSPSGYTGIYGDSYYNTRPDPVMVKNGDSATNQLQRNLWGQVHNAILHSRQLKPAGSGARVAQANLFFLTAVAAVSDTFTISDGTTTQTWTAVAGAPAANQFDQSGTIAQNLESLASQINADSSTWGAAWVGTFGNNIHAGSSGGVVIYRANPLNSGNDRLYGSFATAATARSFDFSGDVDYRRVDLNSADVQLPSSDPAAKTFGYNITSSDAVRQGDTFISILDNNIWSTNKFVGNFVQLGGAAFMARTPAYLGDQMTGGADFSESPPLPLSTLVARNEGTATGITTMSAIFAGKTTIATSDYFLACYRGATRIGGVRGNGDGTTVVYEAFSGGHVGQVQSAILVDEEVQVAGNSWELGMIVVGTGVLCTNPNNEEVNYQPQIELSSTANQKTVAGVYNGASMNEWGGMNPAMPVVNYAAVGRGRILVTDEGGDVDNGDLIVTSTTAGYGMKQADDVMRSSTVAKCVQQVVWASVTDTIDGHKYALVACFLYCG